MLPYHHHHHKHCVSLRLHHLLSTNLRFFVFYPKAYKNQAKWNEEQDFYFEMIRCSAAHSTAIKYWMLNNLINNSRCIVYSFLWYDMTDKVNKIQIIRTYLVTHQNRVGILSLSHKPKSKLVFVVYFIFLKPGWASLLVVQ